MTAERKTFSDGTDGVIVWTGTDQDLAVRFRLVGPGRVEIKGLMAPGTLPTVVTVDLADLTEVSDWVKNLGEESGGKPGGSDSV